MGEENSREAEMQIEMPEMELPNNDAVVTHIVNAVGESPRLMTRLC